MVDAYGDDVRVRFQSRQSVDRNRQSDAFDRMQPVVEAGAQTLYSAFFRRLWNLLVLHDDFHSLISRGTVMGSRGDGRKVRGELATRLAGCPLGERGLRDQEQQ